MKKRGSSKKSKEKVPRTVESQDVHMASPTHSASSRFTTPMGSASQQEQGQQEQGRYEEQYETVDIQEVEMHSPSHSVSTPSLQQMGHSSQQLLIGQQMRATVIHQTRAPVLRANFRPPQMVRPTRPSFRACHTSMLSRTLSIHSQTKTADKRKSAEAIEFSPHPSPVHKPGTSTGQDTLKGIPSKDNTTKRVVVERETLQSSESSQASSQQSDSYSLGTLANLKLGLADLSLRPSGDSDSISSQSAEFPSEQSSFKEKDKGRLDRMKHWMVKKATGKSSKVSRSSSSLDTSSRSETQVGPIKQLKHWVRKATSLKVSASTSAPSTSAHSERQMEGLRGHKSKGKTKEQSPQRDFRSSASIASTSPQTEMDVSSLQLDLVKLSAEASSNVATTSLASPNPSPPPQTQQPIDPPQEPLASTSERDSNISEHLVETKKMDTPPTVSASESSSADIPITEEYHLGISEIVKKRTRQSSRGRMEFHVPAKPGHLETSRKSKSSTRRPSSRGSRHSSIESLGASATETSRKTKSSTRRPSSRGSQHSSVESSGASATDHSDSAENPEPFQYFLGIADTVKSRSRSSSRGKDSHSPIGHFERKVSSRTSARSISSLSSSTESFNEPSTSRRGSWQSVGEPPEIMPTHEASTSGEFQVPVSKFLLKSISKIHQTVPYRPYEVSQSRGSHQFVTEQSEIEANQDVPTSSKVECSPQIEYPQSSPLLDAGNFVECSIQQLEGDEPQDPLFVPRRSPQNVIIGEHLQPPDSLVTQSVECEISGLDEIMIVPNIESQAEGNLLVDPLSTSEHSSQIQYQETSTYSYTTPFLESSTVDNMQQIQSQSTPNQSVSPHSDRQSTAGYVQPCQSQPAPDESVTFRIDTHTSTAEHLQEQAQDIPSDLQEMSLVLPIVTGNTMEPRFSPISSTDSDSSSEENTQDTKFHPVQYSSADVEGLQFLPGDSSLDHLQPIRYPQEQYSSALSPTEDAPQIQFHQEQYVPYSSSGDNSEEHLPQFQFHQEQYTSPSSPYDYSVENLQLQSQLSLNPSFLPSEALDTAMDHNLLHSNFSPVSSAIDCSMNVQVSQQDDNSMEDPQQSQSEQVDQSDEPPIDSTNTSIWNKCWLLCTEELEELDESQPTPKIHRIQKSRAVIKLELTAYLVMSDELDMQYTTQWDFIELGASQTPVDIEPVYDLVVKSLTPYQIKQIKTCFQRKKPQQNENFQIQSEDVGMLEILIKEIEQISKAYYQDTMKILRGVLGQIFKDGTYSNYINKHLKDIKAENDVIQPFCIPNDLLIQEKDFMGITILLHQLHYELQGYEDTISSSNIPSTFTAEERRVLEDILADARNDFQEFGAVPKNAMNAMERTYKLTCPEGTTLKKRLETIFYDYYRTVISPTTSSASTPQVSQASEELVSPPEDNAGPMSQLQDFEDQTSTSPESDSTSSRSNVQDYDYDFITHTSFIQLVRNAIELYKLGN